MSKLKYVTKKKKKKSKGKIETFLPKVIFNLIQMEYLIN